MSRRHADITDEKQWRDASDSLEPLIGVPSVAAVPVQLPATAPYEPEPGLELEQDESNDLPGFTPPALEELES